MMKKMGKTILLSTTMMLLAVGCNKWSNKDTTIVLKPQAGQPIAQVGSKVLTVEALREDFLGRQGTFRGAPNLNTDKARNDYIESQVLQEAMFLDAIELGYFDKIEVMRDVKKLVVQRLMRDKLEKAQAEYQPSDEQIKQHYEENKNIFNREEGLKVAYISIPFGSDKTKAEESAKAIHKKALETVKNANSKMFARLAVEHAKNGTALGQISIETNETEYLEKAAFEEKFGKDSFENIKKLEAMGAIAPLLSTDKAYVVAMKTGFRKALDETVEMAKSKIIKRLAYENRNELYKKYTDELRAKYNIKVHQELVAELSKGAAQENQAADATKNPAARKDPTQLKQALENQANPTHVQGIKPQGEKAEIPLPKGNPSGADANH